MQQEASSAVSSSRPEAFAALQIAMACAPNNLATSCWFHSLPFQHVQALLTLFSKSFSSFPHGTFSLSVSKQYLALDEIYHPLNASFPRNVTRRVQTVHRVLPAAGGTVTLTGALFQETYVGIPVGFAPSDCNSKPKDFDFHSELFPVHSPLLRESYLISCPPLTYMLKFSGFSDLTSCLEQKKMQATPQVGR